MLLVLLEQGFGLKLGAYLCSVVWVCGRAQFIGDFDGLNLLVLMGKGGESGADGFGFGLARGQH